MAARQGRLGAVHRTRARLMDASPRRAPTGAVLPRPPAPPTAVAPAPGARAPGPPPMGVEPAAAARRPPAAAPPAAAGGPVRPVEAAVRPVEPVDRGAQPAPGAAPRPLGAGARGPAQRRPAAGPQGLAERLAAAGPRKAAPRPRVAGRRGAVGGLARLAGPAGPLEAVPLAGASELERAAGVQGRASAARTRRDGGLGPMRTRAVRLGAAGRATAGLPLATVDQARPVTASRAWARVGSAPVARPRATARAVGTGGSARVAGGPTGRRETAGAPRRPRQGVQHAPLAPAAGQGRPCCRAARAARTMAPQLGAGLPRAVARGPEIVRPPGKAGAAGRAPGAVGLPREAARGPGIAVGTRPGIAVGTRPGIAVGSR